MKKVSRIGLLSVALLLGASAPLNAMTFKEFWTKYKGVLIASLATAAAIGVTVALSKHAHKTKNALDGIESNDPNYPTAVAAVALLGPLGMDRTIQLQNLVIKKLPRPSESEIAEFVTGAPGKALAKYWGVKHYIYVTKSGISAIAQSLKDAPAAVKRAFAKLQDALKG